MTFDPFGGGVIRLLLSCILPFFSALILIPFLVHMDKKKRLSAAPNSRSSHILTVSSIGGVGIFIAVVIGFLPLLPVTFGKEINILLLGFSLLFLIGIKDDILDSSPYFKLVAQIIVSLIVIEGAGLKITNFYGVLGMYEIPYSMGIMVSVLLIVTIINSINFIDGIDGLAALIGIVGFTFTSIAFYLINELFYFILSVSIISALAGFLRYNFSKHEKVFMGDTGSLLIGMAFSVFILKLWGLHATVNVFPISPLWVFGIVLLPIFDFIRVFLIRVSNGKSPLRADRNHVHHVLVDHFGFSHKGAAFSLSLLAAVLMAITYVIAYSVYTPLILFWYATIFVVYIAVLHQMQKTALRKLALDPYDEKLTHKSLLNANLKVLSQNYHSHFKKLS
jgi:UDP-GlcNAc:undecaprenyl-phosphate/decaprenyl-phosphate GlcNAc-1-phosphate transferase